MWRVYAPRSLRDKEDVESVCSKISEGQGGRGECMIRFRRQNIVAVANP